MNANRPTYTPPGWRRLARAGAVLLACLGSVVTGRAEEEVPPAAATTTAVGEEETGARVRVSGRWFVNNRTMRELLTVLEPEGKPLPVLDAAFIEDAVLVLQSALADEGFLRPSGTVRLTLRDGTTRIDAWTHGGLPDLPRDLAAVEADFRLVPGVLFYFEQLEIDGLQSLPIEQARGYFVSEGFALGGRKARKYTADGLERGSESLRVQLRRKGRIDASVTVRELTIDDASGAVAARLQVEEGPLHRVGAIEISGDVPAEAQAQVAARIEKATGAVYSPLGRQDLLQLVHVDLFEHGYAEARVRIHNDRTDEREGEVVHTVVLEVEPGPRVRVGEVRFSGDEKTRPTVLRRATDARTGQLLDRNRIEADRLRLSNLGAFSAVRADLAPQSPEIWDLTYQLRPSRRMEVGLLAGYGSYEKLRGGVEVFHANQFGRAERGRLQLVESTKSTLAEYQLTVPQVFGTTASAIMRGFWLDREEVSFDRRESGVSAGARRHSERFGVDVAVRYQYESLEADNVVPDLEGEAPEDSRVGAFTFDISQDRRDNPLSPKSGYELSFALETAAKAIGSDVDYQKLDLKASWHAPLRRGLHLHLGLRHGAIWTFGVESEEIPINKRFFPGGDTTVRGYSEGTAAPRGETGEIIGAEVSTVANVELDLALLKSLSALVFVDTGVTAASFGDYPGDEVRVSAGVGLRYNSLIGPVRLEYGYNVVRETGDQSGQLHFTLGFPF